MGPKLEAGFLQHVLGFTDTHGGYNDATASPTLKQTPEGPGQYLTLLCAAVPGWQRLPTALAAEPCAPGDAGEFCCLTETTEPLQPSGAHFV